MPKFSQSINLSNQITIVLNGDFSLKISPSPDNSDHINLINYKKDNFSRKITSDLIEINVSEVELEGQKHFDKFNSSIEKKQGVLSSISSFISDAIEYKNFVEEKKNNIELEILLNKKNEKEILIISKNLSVTFGEIHTESIKIKSGNLNFQHGKLISRSIEINSGNIKGMTIFNPGNKNIKITSSNGSLTINKNPEFNGLIEYYGNNLKTINAPKIGDINSGHFYTKLNNGKIIFNEN